MYLITTPRPKKYPQSIDAPLWLFYDPPYEQKSTVRGTAGFRQSVTGSGGRLITGEGKGCEDIYLGDLNIIPQD
jgi:hypothetical protein